MKSQNVTILVVAVLTVFRLTSIGRVSGQELEPDTPQIDLRTLGPLGDPVIPWVVNAGNIISEGDLASGASIAREMLGVDGTGITVGVISDSFARNGINIGLVDTAVTAGELPGPTNPNGFLSPVKVVNDDMGTDEGRAMLEIVHDLAPGASLKFHSAFNNDLGRASGQTIANAINALVADGIDIIVDDVAIISQPFFQDGPAAMAVDAAKSAGVAYFSSAGNSGSEAWSSSFNGPPGSWHDFDLNQNESGDQAVNINLRAGGRVTIEWDDPYPSIGGQGVITDFDVALWDFSIGQFVSTSLRDQSNGADPFEIVGASIAGQYGLVIQHTSGPSDRTLKAKVFSGDIADDDDTNSSTIHGHAAAVGAVAVAAQFHGDVFDRVESFSSVGPTRILFDTSGNRIDEERPTALLTAPDGVATSVSGFAPFFGTSAAAPHAAAVAALVLDRANQLGVPLTVDGLYSILFQSAIDIESVGFDNFSGHGRINAESAVAAVAKEDFDGSGIVDVMDIDALVGEIVAGTHGALFDLSGEGIVDDTDLAQWLLGAATHNGFGDAYLTGDSNLDGFVNATDLTNLALNWQQEAARWSAGNFTASDGIVNAADLNKLALNWQQSISLAATVSSPVPEPSVLLLAVVGLVLAALKLRRHNRGLRENHVRGVGLE